MLAPLAFLALAAAPLHAQDPRLAERFAPAAAARLQLAVDSAMHDGLPADPLVLRALEGQAKGATLDQIAAAVARLREALLTSRLTLGTGASPIELTTAAAALQAGFPAARLEELHRIRAGMPITAPLAAYLDLTARGASPDRVWDRVADLARHRAGDAEFGRLKPADLGATTTSRGGGHPDEPEAP